MADEFEELQRLAGLLDEGKITVDEYERLRTELYSDVSPSADPVEPETSSQAPGWYNDPSGAASHQAYWDGEKWTGHTRAGPGQPAPAATSSSKTLAWVAIAVVGGIVLISILALIAVQLAGTEVSETFAGIGESLDDSESTSYGTDPDMDMLYDGCSDGSNADCDMLWLVSPINSEYEDLSIVCGGRTVPIEQGSATCITTLETFSEVVDLRTQCQGGFFAACDALFYISEVGSTDEDVAVTCGGLNDPDSLTSCWVLYGFGTRD